jgi:hypothetical protein
MSRTARAKRSNHAWLWLAAFTVTNTVVPTLTAFGSSTATTRRMTPASCSRWMRRQHGAFDRPTFSAISAAGREASFCRSSRIL